MKLSVSSIKHLGDEFSINNSVYLSPQMAKDPSRVINVNIKNQILKCSFHKGIQKGKIGMSLKMRNFLGLEQNGQPVMVTPYESNPKQQNGLSYVQLEVELVRPKQWANKKNQIIQDEFASAVKKQIGFYFNAEEPKYFQYKLKGQNALFVARTTKCYLIQTGNQNNKGKNLSRSGKLLDETQIKVIGIKNCSIKSQEGSDLPTIFRPDFNIADMGIGGLDDEIFNIFRRTFSSRRYSNDTIKKFGIKHVKGILLHGPPGTGKTLIARQLARALNVKDLKIVNGPQIFSRFHGESEENIRKLFAEARQDQNKLGDKSPLHIIVFDEIDAICKQRGMGQDVGSQVRDQVVNQLLTNIDGVDALNNIIVIGMTNRKDLLDDAILRAGRFEIHIQVHLPNAEGRRQILDIHTKQLRKNNLLNSSCKLDQIAKLTKNFTGAEIEALVKSASSYSISRTTNILNFAQELVIDQKALGVNMEDFLKALEQVKPQFGFDQEKFSSYFREKLINYGPNYQKVLNSLSEAAEMKDNIPNQKRSILLYGKPGTGKSVLSLNFAKHSKYSYIKFITPETFVGMGEGQKIAYLSKIFQDSYKTTSACIVVDSIQKIVNFTSVGRRFSNSILQTLLILLEKIPPNQSSKLLIIGTTSSYYGLSQLQIVDRFDIKVQVPQLKAGQISFLMEEKFQVNGDLAGKLGKKFVGASISNILQMGEIIQNKNDESQWLFYWENVIKVQEEPTQIEQI